MPRKCTGLSLTPDRMLRLKALATELGVSRNETIGLLIDAAKVLSRPAVNVTFARNAAEQEGVQGG